MTFAPTAEQQNALALFKTGKSLVIEAGAGAGKTSTLKIFADNATGRRGQYIAFNRPIVEESKSKFPSHVACSTAHSLAYRSVMPGTRFPERLRGGRRMKAAEIANALRLDNLTVQLDGGTKNVSRTFLAGLVMRGVTRFCQTADQTPDWFHIPHVDGLDAPGERANNREVARSLVPALRRAWADLTAEDGQLRFSHDVYLKMWHLSGPRIDVDFILFDEAQDANPVLLDIVRQQEQRGVQVVWVGDSQQQIYAFTGAINALQKVGAEHRAFLTQSFRFGPAVADVANLVLDQIDSAEIRLTGTHSIPSAVTDVVEPDAILCRTNARAVRYFLSYLKDGLRPHLVGDGVEVVSFAEGALSLQESGWTSHPELACFSSWGDVQDYVEKDEQGEELRLLVKLIDEFTAAVIIDSLRNMPRADAADVVISTAHKSKGREWDHVLLADDFKLRLAGDLKPDGTPAEKSSDDEFRLLYVAVTRAKLGLDISAIGFLSAALTGDGEDAEETPVAEAAVDHDAVDHDFASCPVCIARSRDAEAEANDSVPTPDDGCVSSAASGEAISAPTSIAPAAGGEERAVAAGTELPDSDEALRHLDRAIALCVEQAAFEGVTADQIAASLVAAADALATVSSGAWS